MAEPMPTGWSEARRRWDENHALARELRTELDRLEATLDADRVVDLLPKGPATVRLVRDSAYPCVEIGTPQKTTVPLDAALVMAAKIVEAAAPTPGHVKAAVPGLGVCRSAQSSEGYDVRIGFPPPGIALHFTRDEAICLASWILSVALAGGEGEEPTP